MYDYSPSSVYSADNGCKRCLRSSPVASLVGMIFVLLGGTAFGTGVIFARNFLIKLIEKNEEQLLPYLDYTVYGLVGAIALFTILAYLCCALSSGQNAKECFDSSGKSTCGRCCNMFLIVCLFFGMLLWIGVVCLLSYSTVSLAFLTHRQVAIGQSNGINMNNAFDKQPQPAETSARQTLASDVGLSSIVNANGGPAEGEVDLSYYGFLYGSTQVKVKSSAFDQVKEKLILCLSSATIGTLLMLFGYLMIIICAAMNYARLQGFTNYFDVDNCAYDDSRPC